MSENLPATIEEKFPDDFSESDKNLLKKFQDSGFPGIGSVSYELEKKMEEMYMEGYNYQYIAQTNRIKKAFVLALAKKNRWAESRTEKMVALTDSVYKRRDIFISENEDFIISLGDTIREYCSEKMKLFKSSKDTSVLESLEPKLMSLYVKCFETVAKVSESEPSSGPKSPQQTQINVQGNLNVGDGNKEEPPTSDDLGKVLRALADLNRVNDKK